jgi:hypothetical protein
MELVRTAAVVLAGSSHAPGPSLAHVVEWLPLELQQGVVDTEID